MDLFFHQVIRLLKKYNVLSSVLRTQVFPPRIRSGLWTSLNVQTALAIREVNLYSENGFGPFDAELEGGLNTLQERVQIEKDSRTLLMFLFSLMLNFGPWIRQAALAQ